MAQLVKTIRQVVKKKGAPAYMVSFGDMMTLILCFFILLVAMSKERQFGLLAKGVGSFVIAVESFGLNGVLSANEKQAIFDDVRRRFNLPPEEDPARRDEPELASVRELVRAEALEALRPHRELHQPRLAAFEHGQMTLTQAARDYLDVQADSLRPGPGQSLLLEGHASPTTPGRMQVAHGRAQEVRRYLIERHGFAASQVEARAWLVEVVHDPRWTDVVHARLVIPTDD